MTKEKNMPRFVKRTDEKALQSEEATHTSERALITPPPVDQAAQPSATPSPPHSPPASSPPPALQATVEGDEDEQRADVLAHYQTGTLRIYHAIDVGCYYLVNAEIELLYAHSFSTEEVARNTILRWQAEEQQKRRDEATEQQARLAEITGLLAAGRFTAAMCVAARLPEPLRRRTRFQVKFAQEAARQYATDNGIKRQPEPYLEPSATPDDWPDDELTDEEEQEIQHREQIAAIWQDIRQELGPHPRTAFPSDYHFELYKASKFLPIATPGEMCEVAFRLVWKRLPGEDENDFAILDMLDDDEALRLYLADQVQRLTA
jgi:hypothetical protein